MILGALTGFAWFMLYNEWSPKLKSVWLRYDDKGEIIFAYHSLKLLLQQPLTNAFYWYPCNFDINAYVWIMGGVLLNCIL